MPNHITNVVALFGKDEDINNLIDLVKSEESEFDFEKIIPPPDNLVKHSTTYEEEKALQAAGIPHWYSWNTQNWGTKWNAYDITIDKERALIRFDTAWSTPRQVFEALSKKFPDLKIQVEYADEDIGHNCGRVSYRNGAIVNEWIPNGGLPAKDFACQIKYGCDYDEID